MYDLYSDRQVARANIGAASPSASGLLASTYGRKQLGRSIWSFYYSTLPPDKEVFKDSSRGYVEDVLLPIRLSRRVEKSWHARSRCIQYGMGVAGAYNPHAHTL